MIIYTQKLDEKASLKDLDMSKCEEVALTFDDRKRGRLKFKTLSGIDAGIQIERGQVMRHNSILVSDNGDVLKVTAAPEVVSSAYIKDATLFARACYHLGNRHVSLQVGVGFLRFQKDYVLDDMLHGLGVHVVHEEAEFEPENGAYAKGSAHSHDHAHSHDQDDSHSHDHSPEHEHKHEHA
ncbi:MAG: urease accessory protein UreE [Bermanella sp.]